MSAHGDKGRPVTPPATTSRNDAGSLAATMSHHDAGSPSATASYRAAGSPSSEALEPGRATPLRAEHPPLRAKPGSARGGSRVPANATAGTPRFGRRAAISGAVLAAVSLRSAPARAASDEGGILLGLWRREKALSFAYGLQAHNRPALLGTAGRHAYQHAAALATELAAVGLGTPEPPETPDDLDVTAQRLATSRPADVLANAVLVEETMLDIYKTALPELPDAKIAMTAATILASHAQHLFILRDAARVT